MRTPRALDNLRLSQSRLLLFFCRPGRILDEEEFRTEAAVKYGGLSVEEATRGGRLEAYSAPPNAALAVLGTGLFAFLQGRIAETCRNVYPVVSVFSPWCVCCVFVSLH